MTADDLKSLMDRENITVAELADLVGKGDRTIVYYRAGKWPIPKYLALLLSCVKSDKVSISYLKSMCQE